MAEPPRTISPPFLIVEPTLRPSGELVPHGQSAQDVLAAWVDRLGDEPGLDILRRMRAQLASDTFVVAVRREAREINDPERRAELGRVAFALVHRLSDLAASRTSDAGAIEIVGLGGGSALFGGSMVAALTMTFPLFAVVPAAAGGLATFIGLLRARQVRQEARVLQDLETALRRIISALPEEP